MTDAIGPLFAAGFQHVTVNGSKLLYLPDLHNDQLQREGKPPVYYWLPDAVSLARKQGDRGDYKFSFIHFEGVRGSDTHVGVEGDDNEVAGGLIAFSTTTAPPGDTLKQSQDELLNRFRGSDQQYWGWRTPSAPMFRPAPIVSNVATVTNLSPGPDGSVPAVQPPSKSADGAGPPPSRAQARALGRPPAIVSGRSPVVTTVPPTVPLRRARGASNLDQWFYNLQGQGSASVSPFAENAYSGLVGSLPAALIWSSFHTGGGGLTVWQNMRIKVCSPAVHVRIEGDWDRIQEHYSGAISAGGWFWSADIQAEFNNLMVQGAIKVTIEVDTSLPNSEALREQMQKRSDLVFQKFMDQAQKTIFDPAPFSEQPAEAHGGFLGLGGGAAFKLRRDHTHQHLEYDETQEFIYLQEYPISGQLEGLYDELKADPAAERKYFTTLYLEDWERKVTRIVKPVVNWPDPAKQWVGEQVKFLSAQVGYPNVEGVVQWDGHIFQATDPPDAVWHTATSQKAIADVKNPPQGWAPDKTFLKRKVHFAEPPSDTENPFVRVQIEENVVDLDPGDLGSLVDEINLELRVDSVGELAVGPIMLGVDLENAKQLIEVVFKAEGKTKDGRERPPVKLGWQYEDQAQPRYWLVFTGQPDFVPRFTYQVRVVVKGSIFTPGMEWLGPIEQASASGPLLVSVPTPDSPGVQKRALPKEVLIGGRPAPGRPPAVTSGHAPPPARRSADESDGPALKELLGWSAQAPHSGAAATRGAPPRRRAGDNRDGANARGPEMFEHFVPAPRP